MPPGPACRSVGFWAGQCAYRSAPGTGNLQLVGFKASYLRAWPTRRCTQERESKREDGNAAVNHALETRAQAEQDLLERFMSALEGHSRSLEEQLVGDATEFDSLKDR